MSRKLTKQFKKEDVDLAMELAKSNSLPIYTYPVSATLYILYYFIIFLGNPTEFYGLTFSNLHFLFYYICRKAPRNSMTSCFVICIFYFIF